jgi:uncharacterized protein
VFRVAKAAAIISDIFKIYEVSEQQEVHVTGEVDRFQILSLDGGGLRGMYSAAVLARFEEDLDVTVTDHFDLIAGTSTGGIIALALGLGIRPLEIVDFYAKLGPTVFRDRGLAGALRQLIRSKHRTEPLTEALTDVFGEHTFGESAKRLVITSFNLGSNAVYLFRTPHLPTLTRDWRVRAVDVALATSAAPTYLPAFNLDGIRLVDGGVWANNPVMTAVIEAVGPLHIPPAVIKVFSLGTTTDIPRRHRRLDHGGLIQWAHAGVDVLMRAQSISVTNHVGHLIGNSRIKRLDPTVPEGMFALDKADAGEMLGLAAHISRIEAPGFQAMFTDHIAPAYVPCHPIRKE